MIVTYFKFLKHNWAHNKVYKSKALSSILSTMPHKFVCWLKVTFFHFLEVMFRWAIIKLIDQGFKTYFGANPVSVPISMVTISGCFKKVSFSTIESMVVDIRINIHTLRKRHQQLFTFCEFFPNKPHFFLRPN